VTLAFFISGLVPENMLAGAYCVRGRHAGTGKVAGKRGSILTEYRIAPERRRQLAGVLS
jgi:hypothetical protein